MASGPSLIVDLCDWPGAIAVDRAGLCLSAPASASLKAVKEAAGSVGLFYPPDPNSWQLCGFGGSLATNAGGPNAGKYGMTRHWVLSVDALMADGEIHTFGIASVKANTGPALAQLLVGSEGIFGLITGATVRLIPAPTEYLTLLLPVPRWEDLLGLPACLAKAGLQPSAFEFFDPAVLAELRAHGPEEARRLPGKPSRCWSLMTRDVLGTPFWIGSWTPSGLQPPTSRRPRTKGSGSACGPFGASPVPS